MNLGHINFVGMSRTLGKFIYHVVIITVSEVFYISILYKGLVLVSLFFMDFRVWPHVFVID